MRHLGGTVNNSERIDGSDLLRSVLDSLGAALGPLLLEPQREGKGNWGDVRGTADSLIAIHYCLPDARCPALRRFASEWLASRMDGKPADPGNWEEEVWDTAVATLALAEEPSRRQAVARAVRWLDGQFERAHGNWNDEPWETLWALLAIHAAHTKAGFPLPELAFERCLTWLISLIGSGQPGVLVNWHYTALFCLVARRYVDDAPAAALGRELRGELERAYALCTEAIARGLTGDDDAPTLWTNETWSNALVLWALSESDQVETTLERLPRAAKWFRRRLEDPRQVFTEDRAFACIALANLAEGIGRSMDLAFARDVRRLCGSDIDERVVAVVRQCEQVVRRNGAASIQVQVSQRIRSLRDYVPRAPFLEKDYYHGYYTINLRDLPTKLVLIGAATVGLTFGAQNASALLGSQAGRIVAWLPLVLGALATIAQLMRFDVPGLFSRRRPAERGDD